jgi:hypothetical protein
MNPMKRIGAIVLVLKLGAMLAPSPAFAAKKETKSEELVLVPPADDPPEPGADGTVTSRTDRHRKGTDDQVVVVTMSCWGLTSEKQYEVQFPVGHRLSSEVGSWEWYGCATQRVAADSEGRLTAQASCGSFVEAGWCSVTWIEDVCVRIDLDNVVLLGRYGDWEG